MSLQLPPIRIDELAPETRDWLLAVAANKGTDPVTVLRETLEAAAARDGFRAKPEQPAA